MSTTQQVEQRPDQESSGGKQRNTAIGNNVLRVLGHPDALYAVQVRPLWGEHYRVNVLVGPDATSVKVAHSYFLVADGAGGIVASTPKITRAYCLPDRGA
jgi:hypothetical protein